MALPTPPTDRLDKFVAVAGLVFALGCFGQAFRSCSAREAQDQTLLDRVSELKAQLVAAEVERRELAAAGQPTDDTEQRMLAAKRELRELYVKFADEYQNKSTWDVLWDDRANLFLLGLGGVSLAVSAFGFRAWMNREVREDQLRARRAEDREPDPDTG